MKIRYGCVLAAVLVWTGCGGAERKEAVTLCKVLTQKKTDFAATNALEKDLLESTRSWSESIIAAGSGHGKDLSGNARWPAVLPLELPRDPRRCAGPPWLPQ